MLNVEIRPHEFSDPISFLIISAVKEVLNNLPKVGLISPLVDSGAASVEMIYLVLKGKMTKRDAFKHVIKEARGTINSIDLPRIGPNQVRFIISLLYCTKGQL